MNARPLMAWAIVTAFVAGCAAPAAVPGEEVATAASALGDEALGSSSVSWTGYARVGIAGDGWMHVNPPEDKLHGTWKEGFLLAVHGNVTAMEMRMDWDATPEAEALIMIHSPHGEGGKGMTEYTTQFSSDRHPCFRVPRADLEAIQAAAHDGHGGSWYPMFHPLGGANYVVNITIEVIGGTVEVVEGPHGHDPADPGEMTALAQTAMEPGRTLPCRGALGDEA